MRRCRAAFAAGFYFLLGLDHAGHYMAIREVLPEAVFQRRYVHFLRNSLDHLQRKTDDGCVQELRLFPRPIRRASDNACPI